MSHLMYDPGKKKYIGSKKAVSAMKVPDAKSKALKKSKTRAPGYGDLAAMQSHAASHKGKYDTHKVIDSLKKKFPGINHEDIQSIAEQEGESRGLSHY